MQQYIGTKIIQAEPAIRKSGHVYLITEPIPKTMEPELEGYKITYKDGYESFSPKETFEKAYHRTDAMNFGLALEALKTGNKVARKGWNGKGMFIVYQKGYPQGISCNKQTAKAWGLREGDKFVCNPYLQIKQVDGAHSMWVPSIGDVLAEDWKIVN